MKFSSVLLQFTGSILFCFIFQELNGSDSSGEVKGSNQPEDSTGESQLNLIVAKGEAAQFNCPLFNPDGDEMYWHHESESGGTKFAISSSTSAENVPERFRLLGDFTLQIFPVIEEDSGYYACTIANRWPLRILHYLHVIGPPSVVIEPESGSITAVEGDAVQVGCRPKGNPTPRVTWRKQYGSLPASSSKVAIHGNFLSFHSVSPTDSGTYICKAGNGIGPSAYGRIQVQVLYPPDLKTPTGVIFGGAGYSATLKCVVQGEPPPQVMWIFEQKVVPGSERIRALTKGAENVLHFSNVRESDFGFYMCMANNSVGFSLGYVELSGLPSPPVVTHWETLPCDKNNDRKIRSGKKKNRKRTKGSQRQCKGSRKQQRQRRKTRRNVTCTTVHVRLDWTVESYNPVIDYRLMYRRVKRNPNHSHSDVNEDEEVRSWTELSIPADPEIGPINSKAYTLYGLPSGQTYEAAITARNVFGSSQLSNIFYFSTFPRTSHKVVDIDELFPDALSRRAEDGGLGDKGGGTKDIYHQLGHSTALSSTTTTTSALKNNYLTPLQLTPTLPAIILILMH